MNGRPDQVFVIAVHTKPLVLFIHAVRPIATAAGSSTKEHKQ